LEENWSFSYTGCVGVLQSMEESLTSSRCVVVVLCPAFIGGISNWFHLENLIAEIDVIYIVFGDVDLPSVIQQSTLGSAIASSIKNSQHLTWKSSWPIEDDAVHGRRDIARFYRDLKLAIPNRRRKATAAVAENAAAAVRPRTVSSESASSDQHLLSSTDDVPHYVAPNLLV